MHITIDKYKNIIDLEKYFKPEETNLSKINSEKIINSLLKELCIKDSTGSYTKKRQLLERLLVELSPGYKLTEKFYKLLDTLLQTELRQKNLTDAKFLQRIESCTYMKLSKAAIWKGDITTLKIDAIVNAANNQLLGCFVPFHRCIDNVIHCAAGPRLREDCHKIMSIQGELEPTGKAKVTRAYNLPSRYVIHTVGPIVKERVTQLNRTELRNSYFNCLESSKQLKQIRSIAFSSISTGLYGFPFEEATKIALDTVNTWFVHNPDELDYVVFNVFKESQKAIYEKLSGN